MFDQLFLLLQRVFTSLFVSQEVYRWMMDIPFQAWMLAGWMALLALWVCHVKQHILRERSKTSSSLFFHSHLFLFQYCTTCTYRTFRMNPPKRWVEKISKTPNQTHTRRYELKHVYGTLFYVYIYVVSDIHPTSDDLVVVIGYWPLFPFVFLYHSCLYILEIRVVLCEISIHFIVFIIDGSLVESSPK